MAGQKNSSNVNSSSSSTSQSYFAHFWSSALRAKKLSTPSEAAGVTNSSQGLVRRLGVFDLILLGVGASIGAGIFVVTGTVARVSGPGVTISFLLAGTSCVLNALCFAELASCFPAIVGGAYLYAYTAFNELTAFLVFAQLMLDYHIGAASIARSLASYIVTVLELFPIFKDNIPSWIGHGGQEFLGGALSINILAPILLILLTLVLCWGVGESSAVNSLMTITKVVIVIFVIFAGAFKVDVSNWSPFAPNGLKPIFTGATVVFFAYVGFDAVANSAEESKRPQRDLPIGIMGSLFICIALYIAVCLVITGMVLLLDLPQPFVGLYVQSRLYLGLGRDGLLPSIFAKVHSKRQTPVYSQVWVGTAATVLAGLFNVHMLSHILSVGSLTGYSVVSACVVTLRWKDKRANLVSLSNWCEGVLCLIAVASCGFGAGLLFRFDVSFIFLIVAVILAMVASTALYFRQVYADAPGFSCPGVPIVPAVCIFFNMFLFGQLHYEAWVRFVILSIIAVCVYAFYGQFHADPSSEATLVHHRAPGEEAL
ncbi:putative Cationic amino acid transporter [Quillaja saponaria]|uniref:Cationic amino acid transporter n=1 Tax=Quillaja saponaria TaxID=32244 RepID=A0AAD7LS30_QUISA|nr:putative Cationic amino acid transporter [Quillaja saponaria]